MWGQKQHLLPISATIVVFSATWALKLLDRNFWHRDPPAAKKTRLFRKKVGFLTSLNIQHHIKEARNARNFCRTPKLPTSNIFLPSCKKIMLRIWKTEMDSDFEKFENFEFFWKIWLFENFENFRFWNFLKNFWILHPSKIHNMIWKISWYDIINMF